MNVDIDDLNEEEAKKFSNLMDQVFQAEGDPAEEVKTKISENTKLTDQIHEVISNAENMELFLMDHSRNISERAEYIEDCEWPDKISSIIEKHRDLMDDLFELREDLREYYG